MFGLFVHFHLLSMMNLSFQVDLLTFDLY
ncbi:hypothetical protein LINPERHAP2_LOCUS12118, partial [Linum perenne]